MSEKSVIFLVSVSSSHSVSRTSIKLCDYLVVKNLHPLPIIRISAGAEFSCILHKHVS